MRGLLTLVLVLGGASAQAQGVDVRGAITVEGVQFEQAGLFPGQSEQTHTSLSAQAELRWFSPDRNTRLQLQGFARYDATDSARSHADIREAFVAHRWGNFEVLAGVNRVFWGVTESRHLVDIVNQVDNLEFTNREARLGQPMVMGTWQIGSGALTAIVMSGFRQQKFPGRNGRFRPGLPVDTSVTTYEHADGTSAVDTALRYAGTFGALDIGVSAFHGTAREATFTPNGGGTALVPHYAEITQFGIDAQWTLDATLLKLEAIRRHGQGASFNAVVAGVEYTFFQAFGGNSDLGVIAEYLYDGRDATAPVTPFDNDVFIGARWALNDSQDTSFLVGATIDLDDDTTVVRAEFDRRFGQSISLEIAGQAVINSAPGNPFYGARNDNYMSVGLGYNF